MTLRRDVALRRARRGAAFLDEKLGRGWRRKILRSRLRMESAWFNPTVVGSCGCILAQLDATSQYGGSYTHGSDRVGIGGQPNEARRLGFNVGPDDPTEDFDRLTEAWLKVLRAG